MFNRKQQPVGLIYVSVYTCVIVDGLDLMHHSPDLAA